MIKPLLQEWSNLQDQQKAVLCSVVEWKGSVPRKDYPMMLVLESGLILGTIGGGSMELKITAAARELMNQTVTRVFDFDMTGKDVNADVGLCGGTLKILVEPFTKTIQQFYQQMLEKMPENPKLMVKLIIEQGDKLQVNREIITSRMEILETDSELKNQLQAIFENQKTKVIKNAGKHVLFWQPFCPPLIHIFGAGHVGQSVANLAHFNDLQVNVYDDRQALLTSARFPYAQRIETAFPIIWDDITTINSRDFVLIASREHKHDRELLAGILKTPPAYVGLVSSARKWKLLSESLLDAGIDPATLTRVHAPVGLNIDAQTVPEIAISILSEIIAVYRGALD